MVEETDAGTIVWHPYISWPIFSWALLHPDLVATVKAVGELSRALSAKGRRPAFIVPESWGGQLAPLLTDLQLQPHDPHHVYMAEPGQLLAGPAVNPQVEVVSAPNPETWLELILDGFEVPDEVRASFRQAHAHLMTGDPRAYLYEALIDGERAGAALLWHENGVAGMNTATVRPEYRRRGVHKALFATRMRRGISLGATVLATETGQLAVERVASQWGLRCILSYRLWY